MIEDRSCFYILYADVAYITLYGILKLVSMKATLQQVTSIWMLFLVSISLSKTLDYVCFVCFWFETVYINCLSDSEPIGRGARPTNSLLGTGKYILYVLYAHNYIQHFVTPKTINLILMFKAEL